ncbi:hypothetical protein [Streptomyces sp. NBC_01314]|uniref:hypothetical protein n=1 Tax=Streptomyces sp. NBC_01314 TaxID=2903821 RepID=UPI0030895ED3|nr:hypothetical protein OG622_50235 [Streptomyces sp. NBC_01314]
MSDDEFASMASMSGMGVIPERTLAGHLALVEWISQPWRESGQWRPDRARMVRDLMRMVRDLPGRSAVVALLALALRMTERPAPPSQVRGRTVRRLQSQAGHGALAPVRGSPLAAGFPLSIPGAPLP